MLHLAKQVHAEDAVDEHEQEQQASNVTHGDERVDERREEGTEPRRVLEEPEEPAEAERAEQGCAGAHILTEYLGKRSEDDDKVEPVPWILKVPLRAQARHLQRALDHEYPREEAAEAFLGRGQARRLALVRQDHHEHVETDATHDEHLEPLPLHQPENPLSDEKHRLAVIFPVQQRVLLLLHLQRLRPVLLPGGGEHHLPGGGGDSPVRIDQSAHEQVHPEQRR